MFVLRVFFVFIFLFFTAFAEEFKFKKINFYGLNYFSKEEIINNIVDDNDLYKCKDDIFFKKLVDLDIFNNIEVFWNNNEIKVFCVEKPIINKIVLNIDADKEYVLSLLTKFNLYRGCFYDSNNVNFFKNNLSQFYIFNGFNNSSIDVYININKEFNSVDLNIKINKNFLQRIKNIDLIGVTIFNKNKILSLLSYTKTNWMSFFLKDDIFFPDLVENDIENLKNYYFNKGYSDFHVNFIRAFLSKNNKNVNILLDVVEGELYYINSVNISLDKTIIQNNFLQTNFKKIITSYLKIGSIFSKEHSLIVKSKLKDFLMQNGFFDFNIDFAISYAGESCINVDYSIIKPSKSRIRYINFIGNFFTCDNVLRRMIPFIESSNLFLDEVDFGKNEIIRSGISEYVDIDYVKNPDDFSEVDIYYIVTEQKFGKFTAGLSYGNDDGFSINLNTEISNFLGSGSDISLDINSNGIETDFSFNYLIPNFIDESFGMGYNFYYRSDLFDQDADNITTLYETFGGYLYYILDIDKYEKINFGLGCDMTFLGMYDELASIEVKKFIEHYGFDFKDFFLNFSWNYNSADKFYYSSDGFYHNILLRFNIPGSKIKCYTLNYDFNYYNNFYEEYVLSIMSNFYYGNVYNDEDTYPFFKNFHIRSNTNLRGFKERTLGPKDSNEDSIGGNFLLCSKFSLFLPNLLPDELRDIKSSIFFDIGNVYDTSAYINEDLKSKLYNYFYSLKFAVGISFVWSTPFGMPLEIALAYPFNCDDEDSKNIISLSFG